MTPVMVPLALRLLLSLLVAGAFYTGWLAAVLLRERPEIPLALFALAPVVTAAGFAAGAHLGDHLTKRPRDRWLATYVWPLCGCAAGAAITYPFGPMLIVFGMFFLGTLAMVMREIRRRHPGLR